jgi:acetyl-CoA C-acetyltransferase
MKEVYVVSVARTPIGNLGGVLSSVNVIDLGKTAVSAAIERAGISGDQVEEVYLGCVLTANTGQAPSLILEALIAETVPSFLKTARPLATEA